jgi:hypothetical protein
MSSTANDANPLDELYEILMFKCFRTDYLPTSDTKNVDAIMTLEKVDGEVKAAFYYSGDKEILQIVDITTEGFTEENSAEYTSPVIPEELRGVFFRLQSSFPYRKNLQTLAQMMGV